MKKLVIVLAIIITILAINKEQKVVIPKEAIRFRVIANSNNSKDQNLKKKVVSNLANMNFFNATYEDLNSTRENIKQSLPIFENVVEETLKEENSSTNYTINYGKNYFPQKEYNNVVYEAGDYESLVITIGEGKGDNFWCVLFPPLCLLEVDNKNTDKVEYKSLIKEVIEKYF